jgi:hypothetical protein
MVKLVNVVASVTESGHFFQNWRTFAGISSSTVKKTSKFNGKWPFLGQKACHLTIYKTTKPQYQDPKHTSQAHTARYIYMVCGLRSLFWGRVGANKLLEAYSMLQSTPYIWYAEFTGL